MSGLAVTGLVSVAFFLGMGVSLFLWDWDKQFVTDVLTLRSVERWYKLFFRIAFGLAILLLAIKFAVKFA